MVSNIGRRQMREMMERMLPPKNAEPSSRHTSLIPEPQSPAPQSSSLTPAPSTGGMGNWHVQNSIFNSVPSNLRFNMNGAQNPAPGQGQQMPPPQTPAPPMPGPQPSVGGNPFAAKARSVGLSDYRPSTQSMQASALRGGSSNG
jgi:hypothetical protein